MVPFCQFFFDCFTLDDDIPAERQRGIKNDITLLNKMFIDQVRLYGDRISTGMREEIKLAHTLGIPVVPMTEDTRKEYEELKKKLS